MLVLAASLIPAAIIGFAVGWILDSFIAGVGVAVLAQYAADVVMLWFLGRLFKGFDVSRDY